MWISLRWLEDGLSSLRAAIALLSMLAVGPARLNELRALRADLQKRVMRLAVEGADLPPDPENVLDRYKKENLREKGGKVGRLGYFSVRRRRKKDYNEVRTICHLAVPVMLNSWTSADYAVMGPHGVSTIIRPGHLTILYSLRSLLLTENARSKRG